MTHSSRVRVITYLLPSLLASLLLNIPKFLEARLERMTYVADNVTEDYLIINVTSLRVILILLKFIFNLFDFIFLGGPQLHVLLHTLDQVRKFKCHEIFAGILS